MDALIPSATISREILDLMAEAIPHLVFSALPDGTCDYANRRFAEYTGLPVSALYGRRISDLTHPDDTEHALAKSNAALANAAAYDMRCRIKDAAGTYRWFVVRAAPIFDTDRKPVRWFGTLTDIEDAVVSETHLRFLNDAGNVLSESLDMRLVLQNLTKLGVEVLADWCAIHDRDTDGRIRQVAMWHKDATKSESAVAGIAEDAPEPGGSLDTVLRTGKPLLEGSIMIVPLMARELVSGAITLVSTEPGNQFTPRDLELALALAQRAALAIQNAGAYEREHRVAMTLQRSLLPEFLPSITGLIFSSTYRPSTSEAMVGGDWYDAFLLSDGSMGISIGDVAGHGLEAAALMGKMRELFRATAVEETRPHEMLRRVNRALMIDGTRTMVTAIFGIFDCWRETFTCALAGHPPPILVRKGEATELALPPNIPLGVNADFVFESRTVHLERNDLMALYTDGLTENERDPLAGTERLCAALLALGDGKIHGNPAEHVVDTLLRSAQQDDVALLLARFQGTPLSSFARSYSAEGANSLTTRADIRSFLRASSVAEATLSDVLIAVGEAVNNAIEHAYQGGEGEYTVRAQRYNDRLIFEIEDNGKWRVSDTQQAAPSASQERGRGLFLMRELVNRAIIERTPLGTRVTLEQAL